MKVTKKNPASKRMSSPDFFAVKSQSPARALTIEGFANKAIVDRGGDYIPPDAWELDEFKSNNILLFNHNQDLAIGTVEAKVTEKGLWAKAKISKSNEAPLPYIRDMIKEGIIKSFSVGFDSKGSDERSEDGAYTVLKRANLLELSVVTVPMNQESTFSVSNEVDKCVSGWKTKSYHEARNDMLLFKGAFLARAIHDRIAQLQEEKSDFDRDETIDRILEQSGSTEKILDEVLAGNTTKVPDSLLNAIAENLDLNPEQLRSLNTGIDDSQKGSGSDKGEDEDKAQDGDESEEDNSEKSSDGEDEPEEDNKSSVDPSESSDDKSEHDNEEMEEEEKNFQQCVSEKIPVLVEEGRTQEQAIAIAISHCQEKHKNCSITTEDYVEFLKVAEGSFSKTKQDEQATVDIDSRSDETENAQVSNPSMDQFKAQTTILAQQLGVLQELVSEIRSLRSDLQNETREPEPSENSNEPEDQRSQEDLDAKAQRMSDYMQKLEKLKSTLNI